MRQDAAQNSEPGIVFNFLAHGRPSDRGLEERNLDIIRSMVHAATDAIASKIALILSHLLDVEAKAASGTSHNRTFSRDDGVELECHGKSTNGGKGLQVHIPYCGIISFERRGLSHATSTSRAPPEQHLSTALVPEVLLPAQLGEQNEQPLSGLQCLPACQNSTQWDCYHAQTAQSKPGQLQSQQQHPSTGNGVSSFNSGKFQCAQLFFPTEAACTEDDWDL